MLPIAVIAAGARVFGGDEDEIGGGGKRAGRTRNRDRFIFKRLAQRFNDVAGEFREFIEKEDTVMRERDFAELCRFSSSDKRDVGCGMMRRAERAFGHRVAR